MTSQQVLEHFGITQKQLDHWVFRGYLKVERHGNGKPRLFTDSEVAVIDALVRLIDAGFRWERAAPLARFLATEPSADLGHGIRLSMQSPERSTTA